MSRKTQQEPISKKRVVYEIPGVENVAVRNVTYRVTRAQELTMDLYFPPDAKAGDRLAAVVIVAGYPDPGFERALGCKFKDMGSSVSWGRLIAASGIAAITYTNREPVTDLRELRRYVREHASSLGIDGGRIGLWASSGNVPLALWMLMQEAESLPKCAVLCYGYTLDLEGFTGVAEAASQWGFVNPCAGKTVAELPTEVPLFVARGGRDTLPHLNEALDRFVAETVRCNLPVTFVNFPEGPHAFDSFVDDESSREIVRQILAFLRFHLTV